MLAVEPTDILFLGQLSRFAESEIAGMNDGILRPHNGVVTPDQLLIHFPN
jgi:hypothetical protein